MFVPSARGIVDKAHVSHPPVACLWQLLVYVLCNRLGALPHSRARALIVRKYDVVYYNIGTRAPCVYVHKCVYKENTTLR